MQCFFNNTFYTCKIENKFYLCKSKTAIVPLINKKSVMEKKFTKGEWMFDKECEDVRSLDKSIEGNIICEAPEYWHESMKNWEANAKLIAAAPDLLEALEAVYDLSIHEAGTMIERLNANDKVMSMVKSAIKKALE